MATELRLNKLTLTILAVLGMMVMIYVVLNTRKDYSGNDKLIHISQLISASIDLAEKGGKRVVEIRGMDNSKINQLSKGKTKEGKDEYVTLGDQESNQIIVSGLKSVWPNLMYRSEETDVPLVAPQPVAMSNEEVKSMAKRDEAVPINQVTVWIDPLDATLEYTQGKDDPSLLQYVTVMICIAIRGVPIAGIINQPFVGVTKWGWVDHGISSSLEAAIQKTRITGTDKVLKITYSRSHPGEVEDVANKAFGKENILHVPAAGSGYKTLQVVEQDADLYLHTTKIKKWDICAGNAILNAVGGKMITRTMEEFDYSFQGSPANENGLIAFMPGKIKDDNQMIFLYEKKKQ